MPDFSSKPCTAFDTHRLLAAGPLNEVALVVKRAGEMGAAGRLLTFDDATGAVIDLDLRGGEAEILERLSKRHDETCEFAAFERSAEQSPRGRGRPKLGVVAREVTLLPRHWEWLARQPGGASVVLRRLVEEARKADGGQGEERAKREATYRFMSAVAGDFPGFEEATRALFDGRLDGFKAHMANWPKDVRSYALKLASGASDQKIDIQGGASDDLS
jgi:hypothetical protein